MITKTLKKNLNDEKNYQILIFTLNINQKQKIRSMIFSKDSIMNGRKKDSLHKK